MKVYNAVMSEAIKPYHDHPNPFASMLFGFPVIDTLSGPNTPGDVNDMRTLNIKLDMILSRIEKLEIQKKHNKPEKNNRLLSNIL